MKPLCSVCALRIWKISSCLSIPVAPATDRSFAIWVSFWMLMSFRSVMLSPRGGGAGFGGSGFGGSAATAEAGAVGSAAAAGWGAVRVEPDRFDCVGMPVCSACSGGQRRGRAGGCPRVHEFDKAPAAFAQVLHGRRVRKAQESRRVERFAGGDRDALLFEQRLRKLRG